MAASSPSPASGCSQLWLELLSRAALKPAVDEAVELAKEWRTDKFLRHLEALLLVSDKEQTFLLSGQGDVIEPDTGIAAIGSDSRWVGSFLNTPSLFFPGVSVASK